MARHCRGFPQGVLLFFLLLGRKGRCGGVSRGNPLRWVAGVVDERLPEVRQILRVRLETSFPSAVAAALTHAQHHSRGQHCYCTYVSAVGFLTLRVTRTGGRCTNVGALLGRAVENG